MTFATFHRSNDHAIGLQFSADLFHLIQRVEDYRNYRRTLAALRSLSSLQLADMGLTPRDIKPAARAAVYGPAR